MPIKNSRYAGLPEIQTMDSRGQTVKGKSLRIIPTRSGEFVHRVQQPDRLDLLAQKFYRDSNRWWLIADANPPWALPSDLLDRFPLASYVYLIDVPTPSEEPPPETRWLHLQKTLANISGLESFILDRDSGKLQVELNTQVLAPEGVSKMIEESALKCVAPPQLQSRSGAAIIIPPNSD